MPSFYDDNDEFNELSFDDFAATRRIIRDKHRKKSKGGARRKSREFSRGDWGAPDWHEFASYDDFDDDEFDAHYGYKE